MNPVTAVSLSAKLEFTPTNLVSSFFKTFFKPFTDLYQEQCTSLREKEVVPYSGSTTRHSTFGKVAKFALIALLLPTASALEWNSYADARERYSGGICEEVPWKRLIDPASRCVKRGENLAICRAKMTDETINEIFIFARHSSNQRGLDPVSIVKFGEKTCFFTALSPNSAVTKTCFEDLQKPESRTVEEVQSLSLKRAHEGLKPGQQVTHIGMELKGFLSGKGCGSFHTSEITPPQEAICLLTSLRSGDFTSQTCFDPARPETLTLKAALGVHLEREDKASPVSVLIKDPESLNLNTQPECKKFSLWEALTMWWRQKTPCDEK